MSDLDLLTERLRAAEQGVLRQVRPPGAEATRTTLRRRVKRRATVAVALGLALAAGVAFGPRQQSVVRPVLSTTCSEQGVAGHVGGREFEVSTKTGLPLCEQARVRVVWVVYAIDGTGTATMAIKGEGTLNNATPRARVLAQTLEGCSLTVWTAFDFALPVTFQVPNRADPEPVLQNPSLFYDSGHGRNAIAHYEVRGC